MYLKNLIAVLVALILLSCMSAAAKTVKDQLGRNVDVPDEPKRIVALAPSITEIIFQLNQAHRLKGVTQFSNYPPEALALPKVGSYIRLDLERIVALDPDLCIATKDGNPKEIVARLQSMKIPVYVVDPRNLDTVIETILEIGQLLNAAERANLLAKTMGNRLQRVMKIAAQTEKRPRVFIQIGISPIISVGPKTFVHDLIVKAGGINVAAGSAAYPRYSREQVLALSPEIIIITSMARQADFEKVKKDWRQWSNLPAARNQSIFLVDSDVFNRPSPRLINGLELLVELIHPESFEQNQ
ncbi:MAG: cobalamin-binding protein [Desulfobacterales bacterium]|jgi:iron complex transport system substrate-binding protein